MARMIREQRSDEGWPYPDGAPEPVGDDEVDLDVLELRADPHLYDALSDDERAVVLDRFGLRDGRARSMKELARERGATHAEVRRLLESGLHKVRERLEALDEG